MEDCSSRKKVLFFVTRYLCVEGDKFMWLRVHIPKL